MYFAARTMVLGHAFPAWVLWMFVAGVALIVLFMTPRHAFKAEWFNHVMLPLSLVSNFVDVVSYLRLFAVGFASFAVASAFNEMGTAGTGWLSGLLGAFVIFFGHALNITLAAMGVLVHGIRLNTLEFSSHMGMQWTGVPYAPFARRSRGSDPVDQGA
jgi:V/A-type H+-transporting ATPase subunit I